MGLRIVALILACILAPVVAVCIGTIVFFAGDAHVADYFVGGWLGVAALGAWLGLVAGIPTMLLVGLPLHIHFQGRGRTGLAHYAAGGAFAGMLASVLFTVPPWTWPALLEMDADRITRTFLSGTAAKIVFVGALTGVLAASLFRQLWLIRRPKPNPPTSAP